MSEIKFPADLVDLQRASHAAWEAVEAHRKAVDAERRAAPRVETARGPALREWTGGENTEHARLMAVVREAAEQLRAGIIAFRSENAGPSQYEVAQQLHQAARAGS